MTIKEAIRWFTDARAGGLALGDKQVAEASDMAIAALQGQEKYRWIRPEEQLPDVHKPVLAIVSGHWGNITFDRAYELASWSADEGWIMEAWPELEDPEVTHWMPLPQPPEED